MSSPSKVTKVNYLYIRHLRFRSVRGDLQEGNGCASRCQLPLFLVPISFLPSTKSAFLCAFGVWNPRFRVFRAQNRGFCAFWGSGAPVFGCFEHKIEVFVLFGDLEPSFSSISSTKSGFLCFFGLRDPCFQVFRAQNRGFCAFLPFGTLIFWYFEHKIGVFVLTRRGKWDRKT